MARYPFPLLALGVQAVLAGLILTKPPGAIPVRPVETRPAPQIASTESPLRDRAAFARNLALVKEGTTREEVRRLLGEPDDRWVGEEINAARRGSVSRDGTEAWAYGGNGHLTFPTLGKVSFDKKNQVVAVVGHGERFPGAALPPEAETRRILRMIEHLKGYDSSNDPLRVIQVVNALQPLGKWGALAVIDEFLRVEDWSYGDGQDGLFVVVRCLFEIPKQPGYFPPMLVGAPSPEPPKDPRRSPRFPVVLYRDIPFSRINGYRLGGFPEPLEWHLKPYRESGTIRAHPLHPPDNPLEVIDALVASSEWPDWGSDKAWGKSVSREQALRLVDPVYRVEESEFNTRLTGYYTDQEPQWRTHLRQFAKVKARWDSVQNTYVRPDGTFLPPLPEPLRVPAEWRAETPTGKVAVTLQRQHRTSVDIGMWSIDAKPPMPLVRVFVGAEEFKPYRDLQIPTEGGLSTGFPAPEGSNIRLVLEQNGKEVAETVLRP